MAPARPRLDWAAVMNPRPRFRRARRRRGGSGRNYRGGGSGRRGFLRRRDRHGRGAVGALDTFAGGFVASAETLAAGRATERDGHGVFPNEDGPESAGRMAIQTPVRMAGRQVAAIVSERTAGRNPPRPEKCQPSSSGCGKARIAVWAASSWRHTPARRSAESAPPCWTGRTVTLPTPDRSSRRGSALMSSAFSPRPTRSRKAARSSNLERASRKY